MGGDHSINKADLNLKEVLSFITQMGKTLWDLETITLEI
jgi:hypothetical protein